MADQHDIKGIATRKAEAISRFKKERYLLSLSEDDFRDTVVRPLFFRLGYKDGRDLCGTSEKGKDAIFFDEDRLGFPSIHVVQTKKGSLNMSSKVTQNVVQAATQLATAIKSTVTMLPTKEKKFPDKAILCVSGKINDYARTHIIDAVRDPRLSFLDSDDLIPKIDEHYPEFWFGIETDALPYFRNIRKQIESGEVIQTTTSMFTIDVLVGAAADDAFVSLNLYRTIRKLRKYRGQIKQIPEFQELPVTAVVGKPIHRILILGEAGSGKSTALKRIAYVLAGKGLELEDRYQIPILLRATELAAAKGISLVEYCDEWSKKVADTNKSCFSIDELNDGQLVVLIDALDELSNDVERKKILDLINGFHEKYPRCKVIVTSRDYSFIKDIEELRTFEAFRLSPISFKQAEKIIDRLQKGKNLQPDKAKEIIRRLQEIHGMELNPLLVTVFAATSDYSRQDIPANITELFKKFAELMLGRWDETKGLSQQYHAPLKDFILTKIAFAIHERKGTGIHIDEFRTMMSNELTARGHEADLNQILDEILNRSSLFRIIGNRIEFRHHLLQEFFAGRGIPSPDYIKAVIDDEWWKRPIVFYFGENPSKTDALNDIVKYMSNNPAHNLYYAAATVGLALQACYLAQVDDKSKIIKWVIESFSIALNDFMTEANERGKYEVTNFVLYYLFGRDSVALSILRQHSDALRDGFKSGAETGGVQEDARLFWLIIGLIEIGAFEEASHLLKDFHPADKRFLLAIHLGCYLSQHLRIGSRKQKEIAAEMCGRLESKIKDLRLKIMNEMKSELLEIRQDKVAVIEHKKSE